ncbi:unnamed protein product [Debaryomyces tyrocola]|nr:unnamed protein product [Debaryomyces tyrocola]
MSATAPKKHTKTQSTYPITNIS